MFIFIYIGSFGCCAFQVGEATCSVNVLCIFHTNVLCFCSVHTYIYIYNIYMFIYIYMNLYTHICIRIFIYIYTYHR